MNEHQSPRVAGNCQILGIVDPIGLRPQFDHYDEGPHAPIATRVAVQ